MLRILLVRHGECQMNLELVDKIGGRSNSSPLTKRGEQQSLALGAHFRHQYGDDGILAAQRLRFFSSTAVRAIDTAKIIMKQIGIEEPDQHLVTSDELLEIDMGQWEGCRRSECYTEENLKIIELNTHSFAPPGGESQKQVEERMVKYINSKVLPSLSPNTTAVVVGHGLAFKTVLRHILDSDPRMSRKIAIDNAAVTEIGWVSPEVSVANSSLQKGWHILRINSVYNVS